MAQPRKIRGVKSTHELNEEFIYRDTRPMTTKLVDWLRVPSHAAVAVLGMAALGYSLPSVADLVFLAAIAITWWGLKQREECPLKLPIQSKVLDPHQLGGNGRLQMAEGIFVLGNDLITGKEIWLTNDDCRQHFLVLGTTGAGKTEALIGFVTNALSWSSGFLFCDGKGDVSLFAKLYALARRFGREDDLLVLNFMTGNRDVGAVGWEVMSNTLNPFSTGSSDSLTQMVVSLMDDAGGDGAMWKGRATAMFTGVMRALTYLRDQNVVDLNVGTIRDHLNLKRIIDLASKKKNPDIPDHVRKSLNSYLTSLPGYQEEKEYKQAQTTLDQHGYLEMQFTRIMGNLADVYGHIFATPYGEVDMYDVVLNRRMLVIMLPALEKEESELANLGKIVVATLKGMMGAALGNQIEGSWENVVDKRVTNSPSPFLVILDEVGYYTVGGMALMAAQARSLGFSMIYASQDIPAMKRLNEKEALSIIANTNTKIFMRMEEPDQTAKLAIDRGGKAMRTQLRGYQGETNEITSLQYRDNAEAGIETVDRIHLVDLVGQGPGEMTVTHKDFIVRIKGFYADPPKALNVKKLKLKANHFIKIAKPLADEVDHIDRTSEVLSNLLNKDFAAAMAREAQDAKARVMMQAEAGDEVSMAAVAFDDYRNRRPKSPAAEAGCAAVFQVVKSLSLMASALKPVPVPASIAGARPDATIANDLTAARASQARALGGATTARPMAQDGALIRGVEEPVGRPGSATDGNAAKRAGLPQDFDPSEIAGDRGRSTPPPGLFDDDTDLSPPDEDEIDDFLPKEKPGKLAPPPVVAGVGPRRPAPIRAEVGHRVEISGRAASAADEITSNDAILRMLSDLDFDPSQTSAEEVEERITAATGGRCMIDDDPVAARNAVDAAAFATESALPSAPLAPKSDSSFISDFLSDLLDEE